MIALVTAQLLSFSTINRLEEFGTGTLSSEEE